MRPDDPPLSGDTRLWSSGDPVSIHPLVDAVASNICRADTLSVWHAYPWESMPLPVKRRYWAMAQAAMDTFE